MLCKLVLPSKEVFKLPSLPRNYEELFTAVRTRLPEASLRNIMIKYMDSDQELVSLNNDEDLQTAILTNQMEQVKTLRVLVIFKENQEHMTNINESAVNESNGTVKLVQALEKAKIDEKSYLTQSQAFDRLKKLSMESSTAVKGPSQFTEGQIGAISDFIGLRVRQAMDRNMKDLIPGLVAQFKEKQNNPENLMSSRFSENGPERALASPVQPYYTPTTRKANWFNYCVDCICSECSRQIQDIKYVCLECSNYKCCQECENKAEHIHPLLKLRSSLTNQVDHKLSRMSSHSHISLEGSKGFGRSSLLRQSQMRNTCERKNAYCGKIVLENGEDQPLKTYPSQEHQLTIVVENAGKEAWPKDVKLRCVNGNYRNKEEEIIPLNPGTRQVIQLSIEAPSLTGRYLSQWKLCYNDEEKTKCFGESLFIEILVEERKLQYSRSSDVNNTGKQNVNKGRRNLTIRRGNTFSDSYSNKLEEKRKMENEDYDKKKTVAAYLEEIFPGCLEEKYEFLEKGACSVDAENMTKIVESYLVSLGKSRSNKLHKENINMEDKEVLYPL